ncbi:CDP-alcohol phosphatidyltransferase family protein [Faunimonas sp. B44]|uniref:CDP-alcohol phosphatidyltransferase family protein n=1 Tax=Faunimonas sp. B44 TaxID=3461493 RepID=UPI0040443B41
MSSVDSPYQHLPRRGLPTGTVPALVAVGAALGTAVIVVGLSQRSGPAFFLTPVVGFALLAALMAPRLPEHHRHQTFGTPNAITLVRAAVALFLAGALSDHAFGKGSIPPSTLWTVFALAAIAFSLDAIDGPIARRFGLASAFGARFDMEVDAFLVLVLTGWAAETEKVGPWVLAIGLMRYAFVAAGAVRPWIARPLPPSFRRKAVCVLQFFVLLAVLAPAVPAGAAAVIAGIGLLLLAWSFAIDVGWGWRHGRAVPREAG